MKNKLSFKVNDTANRITWFADGRAIPAREDADFWRMMTDDGYYMDTQIKSSRQTGTVRSENDKTIIHYDTLIDDYGKENDIELTLTITAQDDRLIFDSKITNHDKKTRADELEYPYFEVTELFGPREKDVLLRPFGLGERIENPWEALKSANTDYMSADYEDVKATLTYPRPATMSWFGIQSGENFLYFGRHDERTKLCCLLNSIAPRTSSEKYLASSICQYPFVRPQETLTLSPVVLSLQCGDWRIGSDIYGTFAKETFYHPVTPRAWTQEMTGWQRIILRHQYGEIFWKYEDLPRLFKEGKESGLDTLFVFGWWKGKFDNGYPHYEPDDELGGAEKLKAAIREIRSLGGHVILYNNGILIDKKSAFYKEHRSAARIDIDGNEYEDHYKFENNGTVLRNYGYKSFVDACQASVAWPEQLKKNAAIKLQFDPDAIFFDQIGGRNYLCFNPEHRHGYRPDDEPYYRRQNIKELRAMLKDDQAIGTEVLSDYSAQEFDFIHGSEFGSSYFTPKRPYYPERLFSWMFRRTFPEIVLSNRHIHDFAHRYEEAMCHSFIMGLRFDVSIYRGRKIGVKELPAYAARVKELIALKEKYKEFFYHGTFVCDTELSLPDGVWYSEYKANGKRMFALWNKTSEDLTFDVLGHTVTVGAMNVDCVIA